MTFYHIVRAFRNTKRAAQRDAMPGAKPFIAWEVARAG